MLMPDAGRTRWNHFQFFCKVFLFVAYYIVANAKPVRKRVAGLSACIAHPTKHVCLCLCIRTYKFNVTYASLCTAMVFCCCCWMWRGRDAFAQRLFKNATIIFRLFVSFLCSLSGFFFRVHLSFVCCNFSDNFNCRRPRCTTYGHSRLILCPLLGFVLFSIFCFCMFFALMEHRRPVLVTSRVYKQRFVETGFMRAIFRPYPCAESGPMHVCGRIFLHFFASSYLHFYPVLFMFTLRVVARQQMIRRLGLTVPLALYWRRSKQQKLYKHDTETISKEIYAKFWN